QSLGAASVESVPGKPSITVTAIDTGGFALPFLAATAPAGSIQISQTGTTQTSGANAHGIVAQSISSSGAAGPITVTYAGSIHADGMDADGIRAQSQGAGSNNGNIAITINGQGIVSGGGGAGAAIRFIDGGNNTLVNDGTL